MTSADLTARLTETLCNALTDAACTRIVELQDIGISEDPMDENDHHTELRKAIIAHVVPALVAGLAPERETCQWKQEPELYYWDTGCGHIFEFNDGGPIENKQTFCGYCGHVIRVAQPETPTPTEGQ